jgi:hypothetical protein
LEAGEWKLFFLCNTYLGLGVVCARRRCFLNVLALKSICPEVLNAGDDVHLGVEEALFSV